MPTKDDIISIPLLLLAPTTYSVTSKSAITEARSLGIKPKALNPKVEPPKIWVSIIESIPGRIAHLGSGKQNFAIS